MVPDNVISPLPVPVVTTTSLPESVVSRLPDEPRTKLPLPSSPAETVIRSEATTAAFTVMSSSALSVTIVGSIDAAIVISSAASRRIVPLPFSLALTSMLPTVVPAVIFVSPTTVTLAASVTSEALTRSRPAPALLAPLISIELSSVRSTEPDELKVKVPALKVPEPNTTEVPDTSSNPVTSTLVAPASDTPAVESRSALPAVFVPTRSSDESSLIDTEPAELKVKVPKFTVLPASLPRSTLPAVNSAKPAIVKSPSLPSVSDPEAVTSRVLPTTVPAKDIEPAALERATAPEAETVNVERSPPPV